MKVEDLPQFILQPLEGKGDDTWHRTDGRQWSPGQVVDHLATAIGNSANGFAGRLEKAQAGMTRRPRTLFQVGAWFVVSRTGWFGPKRKAPPTTIPGASPERSSTESKLKKGIAAFAALGPSLAGRTDVFLKHPVFGDLTYDEFSLFHCRHAAHHRKQIVTRSQ